MFLFKQMSFLIYLALIILLVIIDQFSKQLIVAHYALNESHVMIDGFFNLTYVRNYGAGFSILQNATVFLVTITLIALAVLIYLLFKTKKDDLVSKIAYILIIAGAIGNFVDRIRLGYVVDFLDFMIFNYDYPVFNIADSFITIGCFMIIFQVISESINARNKTQS